ncbi:flagellar hook-associated protein 2 [Salinibacillus kushneri]|uniref:Flagellar hook-associated protein 2 n=1 Tax=Salinibacillus kushneri TaxID=237682 RepID=A0A1H9YQT4_9BACI|nr:flagellar filament capping protein FliD [Salinibacillus kushneri]SES71416.1 flagellar hook-associated protein 2 [Salinibacillus kushneri]
MSDMRIGGLASGMDIDKLVNDLMEAERMPLQKMEQDRTWMTWRRDAYREMNTQLLELDSLGFDMRLSSTYQSKNVSVTGDSVESTAGSNAANGSHTIDVSQVAKAAYNISYKGDETKGISTDSNNKIDPDASLWEQQSKFGTSAFGWESSLYDKQNDISVGDSGGDTFQLDKGAITASSIEGNQVTVVNGDGGETNYTITTGTDSIDSASPAQGEVYINTDTGEMKFGESLDAESTIKSFDYEHNTVSFAFKTYDSNGDVILDNEDQDGEYNFTFDGTTSLNQIMTEISDSDVGVSAFYDSYSDKVSLQRTETGNLSPDGEPEIGMSGNFLTNVLGMTADTATESPGQNAKFTIDGLNTERTSNTFSINSVTYTINSTGTSKVSVEDDTETAFENIKEFVEKYNEAIDKINGKLTEERYRDYKPLTDAQKEDMSEHEIELWEEKSKSGLLKGDNILSSGLSEMRSAWYAEVDTGDEFSHLSEIGITTTSNYLDGGKLEINESKLKEALAQDSNAVYKLFSNDAEGDSRGIMNRIDDAVQNVRDRIDERAGKSTDTLQSYTMGRRLEDLNDRIARFEDRMVQVENRYWSQFSQMEQAIQQMNQQSAFLSNQFGGGM